MKIAHLFYSRLRLMWTAYDDEDGERITESADRSAVIRFCEQLGYTIKETSR